MLLGGDLATDLIVVDAALFVELPHLPDPRALSPMDKKADCCERTCGSWMRMRVSLGVVTDV